MTDKQTPSKALNISLWIVQILLASSLVYGASMKLFQPIDKLAAMWPWTGQLPLVYVKLTGIIDLLGAIGIIVPGLLRIKPKLTAVAAIGVVLLMMCAIAFHISRGEASLITPNIVFAAMAGFVAWGRR